MLVSRSLLDEMGGLDERLVTRDQMNFGMSALAIGAKVNFVHDAVVTYYGAARRRSDRPARHLFR